MTKANTPNQTKSVEKSEEKKAEVKRLLYVGPTIYGVATNGSVYIGIPSQVEEARKDVPDLINLFIPIADYEKASKQIRKGTGYIGLAYRNALAYSDKVRNGGLR